MPPTMTHRLAPVLVPLLLLGFTAPADREPVGQSHPRSFRPAAGANVDLSALDGSERLRRAPVHRSPAMTALVTAALRRFADGTMTKDPLEKAIAQSLNKTRSGKAVAKRIVARIDALTPDARANAFAGKNDRGVVTGAALVVAMASAGSVFAGVGIKPPDTLPAEAAVLPSTFELSITGVQATETSDPDGNDELLAMSTFVRVNAENNFVVDTIATPQSGTITGLAAGDIDPLDRSLYSGANAYGFLATAVFEADDDDEALREEYLAMVALAKPLAEQLATPGDTLTTRLGRFAFALDYTIGLLAISNPTRWPAGVLQKSMVGLGTMWATPAATAGAVPWKLAHVHDLPSGHYTLYFDVPSPPIVLPNVKVKITRLESLDPESSGDDLTLRTTISYESLTKTLPTNKSVHNPNWTVQRKVNPGQILIEIGAQDFDAGPDYGTIGGGFGGSVPCGDPPGPAEHTPCPDSYDALDFDPIDVYWSARLTLDIATGKITGAATGNVGDTLTMTGDDGQRGKLKVVITVD